jgi:putative cell wall-binding protein
MKGPAVLVSARRASARSRLAALLLAAAVAAPLGLTAPAAVAAREPEAPVAPLSASEAQEATAAENARLVYEDAPELSPATTATVTGVLQTMELDGSGPFPATSGNSFVRFWLWSEAQQLWIWQTDVDTFDGTGAFTASGLTPGDYRVEFVSYSSSLPMREYWNNKPFFIASDTLPLNANTSTGLGTIRLDPVFPDFFRISGDSRYTTAIAISQEVIEPGGSAPVVYLVTGTSYADALSAGPAAARGGGVMLLTAPTSLPAAVGVELDRLNPARIVVVGGPGVISPAVEQAARAYVADPADVERIYGADRYATSRLIVADAFGEGVPNLFIATGRNFPDALAAGPAAARLGGAVLLINGSLGTTDIATRTLITELGLPDLHLAGGTGAISAGAADSLAAHLGASGTVTRYAGANRYDTALIMNGLVFGNQGADFAFLATGTGFADALAGGPLAAAFDAPLYLSNPVCLRDDEYIDMILLLVKQVYGLGGTGALSDRVLYGENC